MRLLAVFRFELAYQARRPWPWLFFVVLLGLCFLMTRDGSLAEALYEEFFVNSPFAVAKTTVFGNLVWLLVGAAVAGDAAARDVATGMHPLVYTTPLRRAEYLWGRFLAALALNAVLLLAVQAGILLAVVTPGVDVAVVGPFRPAAYLTAYAYLALPLAVVATALQFSLALQSGRATAAYLGSLALFVMGFFVASFLLFQRGLGTLLDPLGIRFVVEDLAHAWTTHEKSWHLLELRGTVLANRLLWLGVAVGVLALTHVRFRFAHRTMGGGWPRRAGRAESAVPVGRDVSVRAPVSVPDAARTFGLRIQVRQMLSVAWASFRWLATSWAGLALLGLIPLLTVPVVVDQMVALGAPLVPSTARVLRELTAPLSAELSRWVIVPLLVVFFAGELVWRERDAGLGDLTDTLPGSAWAPLLGKLLGLGGVLAALMVLLMAAGMTAQVLLGQRELEPGLYLTVLLGLQLPEYLLFAQLALVVHVVVDQKYAGHLVAILAYVFIAVLATMLGVEHNLLVYGAGPSWAYTEMRGFGASLGPWLWFKAYWAAWALLLAVAARLLWGRGRERGLRARLQLARRRLAGPTAWVAGVGAVLVLLLGSFIVYNTHVLDAYRSQAELTALRAEYERRHGQLAGVAQPRLTGARLHVELHPARRAVEVRGAYRLVNDGAAPIDTVHVATAAGGVETRSVRFDRAATLSVEDAEHGHRSYTLAQPLAPGEALQLDFEVHVAPRGFANRGVDPSVVENGSAFSLGAWVPSIGYQRRRELVSAADRREHGLSPRPVLASLYAAEGREPAARGGGVLFEAVVGTAEDQVAVTPGDLRRTWTEGGRRYFHYVSDAPIGHEWSVFSARYAVHEERWNDVVIRHYHHPEHTAHLERTTRAVRASLDYLSAQLGPYPYRHLTLVEHGGRPGTGMHADASIISYGEGFHAWRPRSERHLDFPSAVVAHELAHQWTLPYAVVEGAPFLSEGLAWYGAMQVVKASRGEEELRRLLAFMRQPHPFQPIRRGQPLLQALDPYLSYRRGPFAMYALSEAIGVDRVNLALRRLVERHDAPGAPLATTLDLYRGLRAVTPEAQQPLLRDLFEVNTLWELKTERATVEPAGEGRWQVTLDVRARKVVYDAEGVEAEVPMDEPVQVGVFGRAADGADALSAPLSVQWQRIRSGTQRLTVTVSQEPVRAGIDPFQLLEWEERAGEDNVRAVVRTQR